jgi:agmatine deiminase
MPAEWERHAASWLAWPHNHRDWPGKFAPIPWIIADIIRHIASAETVHLLVQNKSQRRQAEHCLEKSDANLSAVRFHLQETDRIWTRDSGPIFLTRNTPAIYPDRRLGGSVKSGTDRNRRAVRPTGRIAVNQRLAAVGWAFNAWAKYGNYRRDRRLPAFAADLLGVPLWTPAATDTRGRIRRIVLEGGSIDVNGQGCLLTTRECLLARVQQRNPGFSRQKIEEILRDYLGVERVLWLAGGIAGDDTHGHIDDAARFAGPTLILACVEPNRRDPNHRSLRENFKMLRSMRDHNDRPFDLAELPMPRPVVFNRQRLPASYANFYVCNAGVLVPVFNDPADLPALRVLEQVFAGRAIVPIYARDLVWGLGTLHCMTQQQPAV